jgi:hypothetical protein
MIFLTLETTTASVLSFGAGLSLAGKRGTQQKA